VRHVARTGHKIDITGFVFKTITERERLEDVDSGGGIDLNMS
jgi:hypothetical protein